MDYNQTLTYKDSILYQQQYQLRIIQSYLFCGLFWNRRLKIHKLCQLLFFCLNLSCLIQCIQDVVLKFHRKFLNFQSLHQILLNCRNQAIFFKYFHWLCEQFHQRKKGCNQLRFFQHKLRGIKLQKGPYLPWIQNILYRIFSRPKSKDFQLIFKRHMNLF
ncbi:hypothetical protein PPERSA_06788 [Pseudocohnilembus persalinus]|uniref:Uncharacterized protein n=1 Tax=Pseudocohnilembus persalinus TaxID=266149 RepID=A0A0V0QS81_PSEPJ|nr:hypothetical protein PPERSA_06788 [Pseudocohnilembus persalinus]|eukprot:KRX05154.1 hypothetical protein PPERSA_06788 [Pseudocohnilembus persalinus]